MLAPITIILIGPQLSGSNGFYVRITMLPTAAHSSNQPGAFV